MTRTELSSWLSAHGWSEDLYGHYRKTVTDPRTGRELTFRVLLQEKTARIERNLGSTWIKVRSEFYRNISTEAEMLLLAGNPIPVLLTM